MTKPKPKTAKVKVPEPVSFDYEQDDVKYDGLARTGNQPYEFEVTQTPTSLAEAIVPPAGSTLAIRSAADMGLADRLFLIEGRVRLDTAGSSQPVFADQKRIVWAQSFEQAVEKFGAYFAELSTQRERYTVVGAGGSEAIS